MELLLHSIPSYCVGDCIIESDGSVVDTTFIDGKYFEYFVDYFKYKTERKTYLINIEDYQNCSCYTTNTKTEGGVNVPLSSEIQRAVYEYCNSHLADETWYSREFDFLPDLVLRNRLITEFRAIRFAYKLYEGIEAKDENLMFEVRNQILSYATIYEAVVHYLLFNMYSDTPEFSEMETHTIPIRFNIPREKLAILSKALQHDSKMIVPCYLGARKKDINNIRFDAKCRTAETLGLIHTYRDDSGNNIDLVSELIEIYSYRNGIHIMAEQRKGIQYELELSKKAYWRMSPFIDQIKTKLRSDGKY